jgi:hypothetical protein
VVRIVSALAALEPERDDGSLPANFFVVNF